MSILNEPSAELSGPSGGGSFSWRRLGIWLPGTIILGTIVAQAALDAQLYFAPLLIFPLLVGLVLGGLLIFLMRIGQVGHRPTIIWGTILAGLVAVVGQHYFSYLSLEEADSEQSQLVAKARQSLPASLARRLPSSPVSFLDFMDRQAAHGRPLIFGYQARGWIAWFSWFVDGLLIILGIMAVVIPTMLLPFCSRCQTWYRAIRSAHLPASPVEQIARIVTVESAENIKSGRCRLICCQRGCGPTGCELSWEDAAGDTFFARVWLDARARNQVMQVLDQFTRQETNGNKL
jgi:hypothetical protein